MQIIRFLPSCYTRWQIKRTRQLKMFDPMLLIIAHSLVEVIYIPFNDTSWCVTWTWKTDVSTVKNATWDDLKFILLLWLFSAGKRLVILIDKFDKWFMEPKREIDLSKIKQDNGIIRIEIFNTLVILFLLSMAF